MASRSQPDNIPNDSMLNEVQKKIYGERAQPLTSIEIYRLFQSPITPEFNLVLYRAFERKAIDPDIAILQAIPLAKSENYLIPIALCLKFGADVNMYVSAPNIGTVHILGYTYITLGTSTDRFSQIPLADSQILTVIALMLLAKGSRSSLPMFNPNAGKIMSDRNTGPRSLSVREWLTEQGYNTVLDKIFVGDSGEYQKNINKDSLAILSIMLDMPTLMGREYDPSDMTLAIRSYSGISFEKIPTPKIMVNMDYKSLDESVYYLNASAFDRLIKRGQLPSYLLINKILMLMITYRKYDRVIAVQELEKMLLASIAMGTQLDQDQLAIVSVMGSDILNSVRTEYDQPYWRKICKTPSTITDVPDSLRKLALSLNIDQTQPKTAICENLSNLSRADKESLKEAAKRRQQMRLDSELGTMNEFMNGKTPNLTVRNKTLLQHDPLDYNDIDIAYYRDAQGAVWAFSSDTFATILEGGINPYNRTVLPESFKDKLRYQIDVLKKLGIDANKGEIGIYASKVPITFSESIDSLTTKDTISERASAQSLDVFKQLAIQNNISMETINTLTKAQMTNALRSINYNVNFDTLSTPHALVTTSRIIEYVNKTDPDSVGFFFSALNTRSNRL